jgi:hypothetical protein
MAASEHAIRAIIESAEVYHRMSDGLADNGTRCHLSLMIEFPR